MGVFPDFAHGQITPACRGVDTNLFFPATPSGDATEAKQICGACDLEITCRKWALDQSADLQGVWGGMTQNDRMRWRLANRPVRSQNRAAIAEHLDTITALRADGVSWRQIGKAIGYSPEWAKRYWESQQTPVAS